MLLSFNFNIWKTSYLHLENKFYLANNFLFFLLYVIEFTYKEWYWIKYIYKNSGDFIWRENIEL